MFDSRTANLFAGIFSIKTKSLRLYLRLCERKYPILLVHGVCFRDLRDFDVREFYVEMVNDLKKRGF